MAHAYHHALSSVKRWGGCVEDYLHIHQWFDETKSYMSDARHRCLRHHSLGIFESERIFGVTITLSSGKVVPVRSIGEQHMQEDFGKIPSVSDWLLELPVKGWMLRAKNLSETLQ
jgi:hypothetical protein